jgi:hypothetical protein
MFAPFFRAAARAPGRRAALRRAIFGHLVLITIAATVLAQRPDPDLRTGIGYLLLIVGLVEGGALIGWRLTQLPKSQALEFLLTSPVHPPRVFLAEAAVGVVRFSLVWLTGVPILVPLIANGVIEPRDIAPLAGMPLLWGILAGLGLTAWVYEPASVRRVGEWIGFLGVMLYLVVGVVAAERLANWLNALPPPLARALYDSILFLRDWNPFGVIKYWFDPRTPPEAAWDRLLWVHGAATVVAVVFLIRAAGRLRGHFQDRHYLPLSTSRPTELDKIGDRPLSWWAVRRVREYSGRVNLQLAGGFCLLYALFIIAEEDWPPWMGRLVFQIVETWGGAPAVATGMAVMAAVPAAFQFGLWDPSAQDRCRRLELLLLTDLSGWDYWHAAWSAAWTRGRGYLFAAGVLWLALGLSQRNSWLEVLAAATGSLLMGLLYFAVGFRLFASAGQTNGVASLLTLGLPIGLVGLVRAGWDGAVPWLPPGLSYAPLAHGVTENWVLAALATLGVTAWLTKQGLNRCEADLRSWYDANHSRK